MGKFGGHLPPGVDAADAMQDAITLLLTWSPQVGVLCPAGVPCEAWLVQKVWGVLKDKYGIIWRRFHHDKQKRPGPRADRVEPDHTDSVSVRMDIESAIARLTQEQQSVARSILLEGQTQAQVAVARGTSEPAVSQMMGRIREALQVSLASYNE